MQQNYSYDILLNNHYIESKKIFKWNCPYPFDLIMDSIKTEDEKKLSKSQLSHRMESPAAKIRRLARNAERMREKRSRENEEERRLRLDKNALNNRLKRLHESPTEKTLRQVRDAARQRWRRATETQAQREKRLVKLSARMRSVRKNELPNKKAERLAKAAKRAKERLLRETSNERKVRLQKNSEYARKIRCRKTFNFKDDLSNFLQNISEYSSESSYSFQNSQVTFLSSSENHTSSRERVFSNIKIPHFSSENIGNSSLQSINMMNSASNFLINNRNDSVINSNSSIINIPHYRNTPQQHSTPIFCTNIIKDENLGINQSNNPKHIEKEPDLKMFTKSQNNSHFMDELDQQRVDKLRKTAELSRMRRKNETQGQRDKRLEDLKNRARKRRELIKSIESDEGKKYRLAKQAEYARFRRQKGKKREEEFSDIQLLISEKPTSSNIETVHVFDTQLCADSVEWYPKGNFFSVGTYQLDENINENESSKQDRRGRIYLFEFVADDEIFKKIQQIETDAILDQKWFRNKLTCCTSRGNIDIYDFDGINLNHQDKISLNNEVNCKNKNIALSIDVNFQKNNLLTSDLMGIISLIDAETHGILSYWKAHEFEAWTCAFDKWNQNVVYSGGDDSYVRTWDVRSDEKIMHKNQQRTLSRNGGVTSFLSFSENFLFVGSYDENLSIYDKRNFKICLDEINLKGGIWRIKQSPNDCNTLLIACMYQNFSIVDCSKSLTLIDEYNEHESICYGCDWSYKMHNNVQFFATCSFYDKRLAVCRFRKNQNV